MRSPAGLFLGALLLLAPYPAEGVLAQEAGGTAVHPEARSAIDGLWSPYCPGMMLEVCPSPGGEMLRDSIDNMARRGLESDSIIELILVEYGEEYRAEPLTEGVGGLAWYIPPAAFIVGVIVVGIVLIAQFTAAITSVLTEERLESAVSGIGDLYREDVATVAGTTSAEWLDSIALPAEETSDVDIALDQLLRGEVDAVVYDEPVLRRAESTNLGDRAVLLPLTYQPQGIGFAFSQGSALVEPVDLELLSLWESGGIRLLDDRWFGLEEGS